MYPTQKFHGCTHASYTYMYKILTANLQHDIIVGVGQGEMKGRAFKFYLHGGFSIHLKAIEVPVSGGWGGVELLSYIIITAVVV